MSVNYETEHLKSEILTHYFIHLKRKVSFSLNVACSTIHILLWMIIKNRTLFVKTKLNFLVDTLFLKTFFSIPMCISNQTNIVCFDLSLDGRNLCVRLPDLWPLWRNPCLSSRLCLGDWHTDSSAESLGVMVWIQFCFLPGIHSTSC